MVYNIKDCELVQLANLISDKMQICLKDVLNLREAAAYTGYSTETLYRLSTQGVIPYYKPRGRHLFFSRKELNEFLLQNPQSRKEVCNDVR